MELIAFIQVFNIIVIAIGTLLYICCRSFSSSSPAADSDVADSTDVPDVDVVDIASSSSSTAAPADADDTKKYDVFISFRGEDTRRTFTSHLHAALLENKITTYIDDELKRGDEIAPALLKAIKESELSVIVLSKDYASSTWCLDELVHILECKEKHGRLVIPIFYDTLPSDVRKQQGSYEVAFAELEQRFKNSINKVRKWRDALTNAANLSGFDSKKYGTDAVLVKKVVEYIWTKLCRASSCDLKGLFGIESRIEQVESLLGIHSSDACITVGIWGMGGIGKTTLAETVFHRLSSKFEASCFVKNVRENSEKADGLDHLEKTLLKEILKEEGLSIGSISVRERLSRTKVLIVLDDVSSSMQMERLAGSGLRFGTGSRIIITTRDRGTFGKTVEEDNIYEIEGLQPDDDLQLFCSRAFKDNSTCRIDYKELVEKAVAYAKGVPLALTVLGSLFFNCKSKEEWEDEFNKLKRFPSKDIQKVLRISYDGLGDNEKDIFLDIACFHKGKSVVEVKRMLDVREFFATSGIRILIEMSLISIVSQWGKETIEMHDLLQEMGRKIVQQQDIKDPGKRSRLFNVEDVNRVLRSNKEIPIVEAIQVNWCDLQERPLERADFKKMSNLIMLIVDSGKFYHKLTTSLDLPDSLRYLKWRGYPLESLPSNFCSKNLVELHMQASEVKKLWKEEQILLNLQVINLQGCESLVEIPSYFQHLDKLTHLDLECCRSLKYLPKMPGNIQYLNLDRSGIKELPESVWSNKNISCLNLNQCVFMKFPSNCCKFKNIEILNLSGCSKFENFPEILELEHLKSLSLSQTVVTELPLSICELKYLERLDLYGCSIFSKFPEILKPMEHLKSLILSQTAVTELPSSICELKYLKRLDLYGCSRFSKFPEILKPMEHLKSLSLGQTAVTELPSSICELKYLESLDLHGCSRFSKFPEILKPMEHLKSLSLGQTAVTELPSSICELKYLKSLSLSETAVTELPSSICELKYLESLGLCGCSRFGFSKFPEILKSMEHLKSLSLSHTAVTELPSSICELKYLVSLRLSNCSRFSKFPEILKPMEHLVSLCLEYTAVEMLPSSIGNLNGLQDLNLRCCYLLKDVPTSIYSLTNLKCLDFHRCLRLEKLPSSSVGFLSLKELELSFSGILEIPASIKQASRLSILDLNYCKRLQSIPELPVLCNVKASNCKSLKKVSSSRTALTQGWDKPHYCFRLFLHCPRLNNNSRSNIMDEAQITVMRMATVAPLKDHRWLPNPWPQITIACPGKETPNWFSYQNEGSSIDIELCPDWFRTGLFGFALSVVLSGVSEVRWYDFRMVRANFIVKFMGESHELFSSEYIIPEDCNDDCCDGQHHVLVWSEAFRSEEVGKHCSPDVYKLAREASVVFCPVDSASPKKVESCGICPLYAEDAEKFKFGHVFMSRGPKVGEETRQDDHSKGGGSGDEPQVSGFSIFPEILMPMEHLVSLCLEYTAVEMLPSSIGNLNGLQDLNLRRCYLLKDVPTSIYSLTNLKRLNFNECGRLEKLPSSSVGFISLEELDLSKSGILEIPASIKQASRLSILNLKGCKRLQSIPELPVLCNVKASNCKSLKIVSSSRTALAQGWDKPKNCFKVFSNCPKLDNNSRSNIMDEAQITIMRMATVAPFKYISWFREPWIHNPWPQINTVCPGKEIPNWFSYQNEGSSVDIELCPDWFRTGLFGFALSLVLSGVSGRRHDWRVRANFIVKFMGESHELFSFKYIIPGISYDHSVDQHHVHVWNEGFRSEAVGKNCSPDVYKLAKEASVVFFCPVGFEDSEDSEDSEAGNTFVLRITVERCGICPLYAEDAEKFNFGHEFMSRGPKVGEETRQDDFESNGTIGLYGQHTAKKPKILKQSLDTTSGGPWSHSEDQALVVLVHDMGPNWELISDAINSTLHLKCIFRKPKECKERHKILMDMNSGDGADSAEDSGSSQPYPSPLPGIPKGSARQSFQRLQEPTEEDVLKSRFEKLIKIVQKHHYRRSQVSENEHRVAEHTVQILQWPNFD
nr:protein SUPPRESSOR OF npr1-1, CONSTITUTIVE 1-like isoform X2 [Malus domestica]